MTIREQGIAGPFLAHRFAAKAIEPCVCGAHELYRIHEDYVIPTGSMIEEYFYCAACQAEWHAHDESVYPMPKVEAEF